MPNKSGLSSFQDQISLGMSPKYPGFFRSCNKHVSIVHCPLYTATPSQRE